MKTAYRIVTPILALGGIALGIFLKLFSFVVGNSDDTINNLISAVSQLSSGKFSTNYSYSLFELIKMASTSTTPQTTGEDAKSFTEVASAIMPNIYAASVKAAEECGLGYNLVAGANIAGFKKVADAMMAQGIV